MTEAMTKLSKSIAAYIDERVLRSEIGPLTESSLRYNLGRWARVVEDPEVGDLQQDHVDRWFAAVDLAPSTRRTQLSQIRGFCRWAAMRGLVPLDPTLNIRTPVQPRVVPRGLRAAEVATVLDGATSTRARLVILLMVQEGLRRKEVAGIALGDIDRAEGIVMVTGKGGHQRVLPLANQTQDALDAYLGEWPAVAGPLIRSVVDGRSSVSAVTVGRIVSALMTSTGVKVGPYDGRSAHACRHTAAADMLRSGAHLRDVQAALGHVSIATTQRYLPWVVGDLRTAMGGRHYGGGGSQPTPSPSRSRRGA